MVIVCWHERKASVFKSGRSHDSQGYWRWTYAKELEGHWKKTTLMQKLIGRKIRQKERDEEERILYVALTRAVTSSI